MKTYCTRPRQGRKVKKAVSWGLMVAFAMRAATSSFAELPEPLWSELQRSLKSNYLNVSALLQTVADFQPRRNASGRNGFSVPNFRLQLRGDLDGGWGYLLQTNFAKSPALLDAKLYLSLSDALTVDAGAFKAPFSKEFLTGAAHVDFVNRSQVVTALAPGRQIGLQVRGSVLPDQLTYAAGIFNGNGITSASNDDNDFLYAGRTAFHFLSKELEVGLNAAYSKDTQVSLGGGFIPEFQGERSLYGGDVRWSRDKLLASMEAIGGTLNPAHQTTRHPWGYHVTGGYALSKKSQALVRWDSFNPDGLQANSHRIVLGCNVRPTSPTQIQLNWAIPADQASLKHHQFLAKFQIAL